MFRRRDVLALAAALAVPARAAGQPGGRIHALLVGINAYRKTPLRGCVNDVRLIGQNLGPLGATITTLLDATRGDFFVRWNEATARAAAGDTFIFHFSGHGMRDPRERSGETGGGSGNCVLFRDHDPRAAPGEILIDTELHRLLIALHRRGIQPIAILDCCYAGALTRSIDPRASGADLYRTPNYSLQDEIAAMASQPPPPPPPPPAELAPVLFLAAGQATEAVPEVRGPNGDFYGALSLGFARAITGEAGTLHPGVLTRGELFNHILTVTRSVAESRQHPMMRPPDRQDEPILPVPRHQEAMSAPGPAAVAWADAPVRLGLLNLPPGEAAAIIRTIPNTVAAVGDDWDLRWDAQTQEAFGPGRDRLAEKVAADGLGAVAQRVRAQRRLNALVLASGLSFRLVWQHATGPMENDAIHPAGRRLELRTANLRLDYLIVFNLTGDGIVQCLYPWPPGTPQEKFDHGVGSWTRPFCVSRPFGSDLAVAVAANREMPALASLLWRRDGEAAVPEVMAALEAALAGADWQIGVQTVVTRANQGEERECGR